MKKLQGLLFSGCLYLGLSLSVFGKASLPDSTRAPFEHFRLISLAYSNPIYRDYATSPLFYRGPGVGVSNAWLKRAEHRERLLELDLRFGMPSAKIPESSFIQPKSSVSFPQFNLRYSRLYRVKAFKNEKNKLKIGGTFLSTLNMRLNPGLQNNATGFESLVNMMFTAQLSRDISRTQLKELNFWIWKPKLKPVKRELRFRFDAGLLNWNYRPGYAYTSMEDINGVETNPLRWLLSRYSWTLNGTRFQTVVELAKYLPNGNARSWSYVWEMATAPGNIETLQMAFHQLRYTWYFKSDKR